jgi:hypothetical protein
MYKPIVLSALFWKKCFLSLSLDFYEEQEVAATCAEADMELDGRALTEAGQKRAFPARREERMLALGRSRNVLPAATRACSR